MSVRAVVLASGTCADESRTDRCRHRYLIWIGSDQEKTFGPTIAGLIYRHLWPDRVCLWDSKARGEYFASDWLPHRPCIVLTRAHAGGRPDVVKLIKDAYHSWGAEVVFITSNWQGNKELMEGCKAAGIPAFVRTFCLPGGLPRARAL